MDKKMKRYLKLMRSGQITDIEVSEKFNISLSEIQQQFIKFNKKEKRKKEFIDGIWFDSKYNYLFNIFMECIEKIIKKYL